MLRAAIALFLLSSAPVLAADTWPAPQPGPTDWSGGYVGAHMGLAASEGRALRGAYTGALITLDVANGLFPDTIGGYSAGILGGLSAGYNAQFGQFVGGIEGDISLTHLRAHNHFSRIDPGPIFPGVITNTSYQTDISGVATLRLRGGVAMDDLLVFASAGLAAGHVTNRFTLNLPNFVPPYSSPDWSRSGLLYGYAAGVGFEKKLSGTVSLKAEALYVDLQDTRIHAVDAPVFGPTETIDYHFTNDALIARVGLNYLF